MVVIDDGEKVHQWGAVLEKCSALPGIRNLHDFIFVRQPGSDVKLRVHHLCYTGAISDTIFHVKTGYSLSESAILGDTLTYKNSHFGHSLTQNLPISNKCMTTSLSKRDTYYS